MMRLRFAPSPTGHLHIGGVRTALFNFLAARRDPEGKFFVRIEDTDQERSRPEYEKEILDSLAWLGLCWDGEILRQSSRLSVYRKLAESLMNQGKAYEVEEDGKKAIRFRMPKTRVKFQDLIHGPMEFDTSLFDDLVILKSDGYPTYHWACVVDDHEMEMTHVIRGDDHLSNTPRQLLLFDALGWQPPQYGHLPLILGDDGAPLSKRHGAVSLSAFRQDGYLPEALLNYLALLGWAPSGGNQEFFTLKELIQKFSLKQAHKSGAQFSLEKMAWLNAQHLKKISDTDYEQKITEFYPELAACLGPDLWKKLVRLYRLRIQTLSEFKPKTAYIFEGLTLDNETAKKYFHDSEDLPKHLRDWLTVFEKAGTLIPSELEAMTRGMAQDRGISVGILIHPLRFALTGSTASPGLFEIMEILGKDVCLSRIRHFLTFAC